MLTRRDLGKLLVGAVVTTTARADQTTPPAYGVDHFKLKVVNAGASAMFYYDLFGGEVVSVRNGTMPESPMVDEFFLKVGDAAFPYLMLSQMAALDQPGLEHLAVLVNGSGITRIWDADGRLVEIMSRPTWGGTSSTIQRPLPVNWKSLRPAFQPIALRRVKLLTTDPSHTAQFYGNLLGWQRAEAMLEFKPNPTPGLDRLVFSIHKMNSDHARRILRQRGIHTHGSRSDVLFRDVDGNLVELVAR